MTYEKRAIGTLIFLSLPAWAQAAVEMDSRLAALEAATKSAQSAGDNAWMLTSAALVLMMTGPGLRSLWRTGEEEEHPRHHDAELRHDGSWSRCCGERSATAWHSEKDRPSSAIFDTHSCKGWARRPMPTMRERFRQQTFMIYQLMFAIITPALITGAFAERMKFSGMLLFMTLGRWWSTSRWPIWCGARAVCLTRFWAGQSLLRFRRRHGRAYYLRRLRARLRALLW